MASAPKNPNQESRVGLVTRNVTLTTYEVTYLPEGQDTVCRTRKTLPLNDQLARREIRKMYKDKGFITAITKINEESKLLGMTMEDFISNAHEIKSVTEDTNNG